jgi:hypothetical protein
MGIFMFPSYNSAWQRRLKDSRVAQGGYLLGHCSATRSAFTMAESRLRQRCPEWSEERGNCAVHRILSTFVLTTLILITGDALSANPIPISGYSATVLLDGQSATSALCPTGCSDSNDVYAPGTYSLGEYSAIGEVVLGPIPYVHAFGSSSFGSVVNARAGLYYYFEFAGPAGSAIPIDIDVVLESAVSGTSLIPSEGGRASVALGGPINNVGVSVSCTLLDCSNPDFIGTLHAELSPNTVYIMEMGAGGGASQGDEGFNGFADPYIYIDPSFADAADYQFVVSDGIGNQTGLSDVPEPNSLLLAMVSGLALGGVALFRRSRAT